MDDTQVINDFLRRNWDRLLRTDEVASCPVCKTPGLEVREERSRGKVWRYVLHCKSVRVIAHPARLWQDRY